MECGASVMCGTALNFWNKKHLTKSIKIKLRGFLYILIVIYNFLIKDEVNFSFLDYMYMLEIILQHTKLKMLHWISKNTSFKRYFN